VLSYDLWHSQFAGDQDVIGQTVRLDGAPHTVVGVMPPGFHFPSREAEIWTPLVFQGDDFTDRNDTYIEVVARLAPGVTFESARAEMVNVTARLEQQYPEENKGVGIYLHRLRDQVSRGSRLLVVALCGASLCILLLSCANLAGIMLARGFSRTRELAVRTALGAGRERLIRQLMTESVFLAVCGGLLGVGVAVAGLPLLSRLVPNALPVAQVPTVDLRVMIFAAALIGLTGLGFGVAPALRAANHGALEALRERTDTAGRSRQRLRSALVVLEVTGSIVLLVTSGLLMRAIWRMQAVDPGFRTEGVMTLRTALPLPKYQATAARVQFYGRVLEQVRALPGVQSAAYATGLPIERRGGIWPVIPGGGNVQRTDTNSASLRYVTPQFFLTLGIPLRGGRDFSQSDVTDSAYVAVVSESLARREWPNQDPIGRKFGFAQSDRTVIGVVGDVRVRGLEFDSEPQVYVPASQVADNSIIGYIPQDLIIRSSQSMEQLLPSVRRIIAAADPEQPVSHVRPLSEIVADYTAPRRVQIRLLMILSAIALLIAGVGIHGLLSFAVNQRIQELGIRRALGAQAGEIVGMVVREGLRLVLAGALVGVILALMIGRGMNALLFGVAPDDLQTIVSAVALCLVTALLGCLRPALQAARVDPMTALRER
jgi:putative ABC transport system permease protein